MRGMKLKSCVGLMLAALPVADASAVFLYSSPTRNTDAPGSLTNRGSWSEPGGADDPRRLLNSGWQWQGTFDTGAGFFLGTAIAPNYFITARHVDFGSTFIYQGQSYNTIGSIAAPGADLRLWQVDGTFSSYAPLYDASVDGLETGKSLVVIGRGTQRGAEVRDNKELKGWQWGPEDHVQSWGENAVTGILDASGSGFGDVLYFDFDATGGPNEAALSGGDSGGGLFIESGSVWKLAGINLSADGPWSYTDGGSVFNAALFDYGGMYYYSSSNQTYTFLADQDSNLPASSYSTRISSNLDWIRSIIGTPAPTIVPEPTGIALVMMSAVLVMRRRPRA